MMSDDCQLRVWTGKFGDEYITRNEFADWKLPYGTKAFKQMLNGLEIKSILEVGSSIGLNLHFIKETLNKDVKVYAVEPNKKAYERLISNRTVLNLAKAWNCDVYNIPLDDSSIDFVFTAGVLVHISPERLGRATDEIVRIARKYVLCIEYFSHTPISVKYRGRKGLLFKRDFGKYYLDRFPDIKCIRYGFLWQNEFKIFDNLNWWLFERNYHG